ILEDYSQRCQPPWSEKELRHKLESADEYTGDSRPRGYLLRDQEQRRAETRGRVSGECHAEDEPLPEGKPLFDFEYLTGHEFFYGHYEEAYLIEDLLVADQPMVIGAAKKTLKTTLMIEMAVALANAFCFLGKFTVPKAVPVGIMSGESGKATLQEIFKR